MTIFEKGNYQKMGAEFRTLGFAALEELSKFQEKFEIYNTDTTINGIRDTIIANYLGFGLINMDKHGFDAKKEKKDEYLEVKQCSVSSKSWGRTWNDTNEEKAKAFSDKRLYTIIGVWKGASDLQFMIYGQNEKLGELLLRLVVNRKEGSRSTQTVSIQKLIKDFNFKVICPPNKSKEFVYSLLINYKRDFIKYLRKEDIYELRDI